MKEPENIEHLNKSQIVLLTLLVAFVSSITTAIITVALIEQAPPEITQTVNRIVERTVERIVPTETEVPVKETTQVTVIKEGDQIAQSAEKNTKYLVRLYAGTATTSSALRGVGVVVAKEGLIVTDASLVSPGEKFTAMAFDGTTYTATPLPHASSSNEDLGLMTLSKGTSSPLTLPVPLVQNPSKLKLGSTVFSLSGKERPQISIGFVRDLIPEGEDIGVVATTVNAEDVIFGSPLFSVSGELVAIHTSGAYRKDRGGFTPYMVK